METAPTLVASTSLLLNNNSVGILLIEYTGAVFGFSSIFNFPTITLLEYSFDISSKIGAKILQGLHH
ncbi:hypothetical protein CWU_03835 [Buchnera aphidicola str. JF98 (Acyrthosiphon pisum)]|nr:hypothetical protein CWU_03835 [Buchnera aphidicola str. JF98 (Acyrthosiphon pisum)]